MTKATIKLFAYIALLILIVLAGVGVFYWQHRLINIQSAKLSSEQQYISKLKGENSMLQAQLTKLISENSSLQSNQLHIYHIGDTQDGITLVGMYRSSYQDLMGGNGPTPPTISTIVFALSGVSQSDAFNSIILTTAGSYMLPDSKQAPIAACSINACVGFDVSDSNQNSPRYTAATFFYKNLQWQL